MSTSIPASYSHTGHSAEVKMHLTIGDMTLSIGQLGPDFLLLRNPIDHPPTDAILFFSIDGNGRERKVRLPDGISLGSRRVVIAKAE